MLSPPWLRSLSHGIPCPGSSPAQSQFLCFGLLPVPSSALSVGRAVPRGSSFPFVTSLYKENKRVRDSSLFFLFLSGLQTSKLFEIYFADFDVKVLSQCNFIKFHSKIPVLWSGPVNSAAR